MIYKKYRPWAHGKTSPSQTTDYFHNIFVATKSTTHGILSYRLAAHVMSAMSCLILQGNLIPIRLSSILSFLGRVKITSKWIESETLWYTRNNKRWIAGYTENAKLNVFNDLFQIACFYGITLVLWGRHKNDWLHDKQKIIFSHFLMGIQYWDIESILD